jgi:competence protein ComEA
VILAVLRPWLDPRPGELRGLVILLAAALTLSLALWFDAARRPMTVLDGGAVAAPAGPALDAPAPPMVADGEVGTRADGSDGWGLGTTGADGGVGEGPVVHVSGAVLAPGVVALDRGSRVADAIAAAGGAMPDAQLDRLNLARILEDGEQVHVTRAGEDAPPPEASASRGVLPDGRIDLNTASASELETLPGVGPARAQAIIAEREVRPFQVPGDLRRVPGIGEVTFQRLAPLVAVR